jgi:hypothetical protein
MDKRIKCFILSIALIVISASAFAEKSGPFASANFSHAVVQLPSQRFEPFRRKDNTEKLMGIGGGIGYLFDSRFIAHLEVDIVESGIFGTFDGYRLTHIDLSFGYRFRWKKMHFTPKVGHADWRLRAKEGMFLNPGIEESRAVSDNDLVWGFSIGYSKTQSELILSYKNIDTDFGSYDLSNIGILIRF